MKTYIKPNDRTYLIGLGKPMKTEYKVKLYRIGIMFIRALSDTDAPLIFILKHYLENITRAYQIDENHWTREAIIEVLLIQKEVLMMHFLALKTIAMENWNMESDSKIPPNSIDKASLVD